MRQQRRSRYSALSEAESKDEEPGVVMARRHRWQAHSLENHRATAVSKKAVAMILL